jgi:hypothetical protein
MMSRCSLGPSREFPLIIIVHVIVHPFFSLHHGILLVVFLHKFEVDLVVDLEPARLDLLLPHVVVDLHVVEDGVDEDADVGVLVREELEHDRDHLRLVQHDLSRRLEEQELEEGVQDLLHHLVVLLLGAQEILEHLD